MNCPICNFKLRLIFKAKVLRKYTASYQFCGRCGFLRAKNPHWLEESYSSSIAVADTGIMVRNIKFIPKVASLIFRLYGKKEKNKFLDVAGGYGIFSRLMRDIGFNFYWSDKYTQNIIARGFEAKKNHKYCVLTAFEVMEHLDDPVNFLDNLVKDYNPDSIIFSTELYKGSPPKKDWWYYAFNTGQHISFYSLDTLKFLAKKFNFNFYTSNGIHMFSKKTINKLDYKICTSFFSYLFIFFYYVHFRIKNNE